jgi:hypothetical protein
MDQQRRMQGQQQKMWQENLRRQQMYAYYKGKQQKKPEEKKPASCAVCGSVLLIKICPLCRRFFCNTHLSAVKFGSTGHQCLTGKPIPTRMSQPQQPPKTPKKPTENIEDKKYQDEMLDLLDRIIEDEDFEFES